MNYYSTGYQRLGSLIEQILLQERSIQEGGPVWVSAVGNAVARMYRGTALLSKGAKCMRALRARRAGHPYPLPMIW